MHDLSLDLLKRTQLIQYLLARGMGPVDYGLEPDLSTLSPAAALTADLDLCDKFPYNRLFEAHYAPIIRAGAPAKMARRLGSWMQTHISPRSVICYTSELHLNQDSIVKDNAARSPLCSYYVSCYYMGHTVH